MSNKKGKKDRTPEKEFLLTIGMIVKNEEKVLRRCLDSLVPIMEAIPTELLITDTGSTDATVEICKEYTDKISYFEWNNDFSAARNVALSQAKGKWFMMFDADGWFEDSGPILEFFKSRDLDKYESASVTCRSYEDMSNRNKYSESEFQIFNKIYKGIHYEGRIHENISISLSTHKVIKVICHHSGYDFTEDEKKKDEKFQRNLIPLYEEQEKNPDDLRMLYHLVRQLFVTNKKEETEKYIEKSIAAVKGKEGDPYYSSTYKNICEFWSKVKKFHKTVKFAEEYLNCRIEEDAMDLDFYIIIAVAYQNAETYQEAVTAFDNYFNAFNRLKSKKVKSGAALIDKPEQNTDAAFYTAKLNEASCYLMMENPEEALKTVDEIDMHSLKEGHMDVLVAFPLSYGEKIKNYEVLFKIFKKVFLAEDDEGQLRTDRFILNVEAYLGQHIAMTPYVAKAFAESEDFHPYCILQKLRYLDSIKDTTGAKARLLDFNKSGRTIDTVYGDILFYTLKYQRSSESVFLKTDENELGDICYNIAVRHRDLRELLFELKEERYLKGAKLSLKDQLINGLLLEQLLIRTSDFEKDVALANFDFYGLEMRQFMSSVYTAEILNDEDIVLLSSGYRFAYYVNKAVSAKEKRDKLSFIKYLKEALLCYPPMKAVIEIVLEDFEQKENKQPLSEFEKYSMMVKDKIKELLDGGMRGETVPLIEAYEQVNPGDEEITLLKKRAGMLH